MDEASENFAIQLRNMKLKLRRAKTKKSKLKIKRRIANWIRDFKQMEA